MVVLVYAHVGMLMEFRYTNMADIAMILVLRMISVEAGRTNMIKIVREIWLMQ